MRHSKAKNNKKVQQTYNLIEQKMRLSEIMNFWQNQYAHENADLVLVLCDCQSKFNVQRQYRVMIETGREVDTEDYSNNYDNQFERFFKKRVNYPQEPNIYQQSQTKNRKKTFQDLTNQAPKFTVNYPKMDAHREQKQNNQNLQHQQSQQSSKLHQYNSDNQDYQKLQHKDLVDCELPADQSINQKESIQANYELQADQSISQKESVEVSNNQSLSRKNNFSFKLQQNSSDIILQVDSKPEQDQYRPIQSPRQISDNLPFEVVESEMCQKSMDKKESKMSIRHSQSEYNQPSSQQVERQSELIKPVEQEVKSSQQDQKLSLNKLRRPNYITVHELKIRYLEDRKAPVRVVKLLSPYK